MKGAVTVDRPGRLELIHTLLLKRVWIRVSIVSGLFQFSSPGTFGLL